MARDWILVLLLVFLALQFFIINGAQAEYRVYRLGVKYSEKQPKETEITTTLDDLQYATYYKMTPNQTTRLIDHWMCWGHTDGFKRYCAKPSSAPIVAKTGTPANSAPAKSPNPPARATSSAQNPVPVVIQ